MADSRLISWLQRVTTWLHFIPGGALLFAVVPMLILGYLGWFYYGADHVDRALYAVKAEQLTITPQPPWIKSNVAENVFRHASLDSLSLLDPKANAAIAQAFETDPWVKSTTRVTKSAGGKIAVDLIYRRPVAMVYCTPKNAKPGCFAVDEDAILLPRDDFEPQQVYDYFQIIADGAPPAGDYGMPYGNTLISEALKICSLLEGSRETLGLQRVYVEQESQFNSGGRVVISLETTDKHLIQWGHVPGDEVPGESRPLDKLNALTSWLQEQRDSQAGPSQVNLLQGANSLPVSKER